MASIEQAGDPALWQPSPLPEDKVCLAKLECKLQAQEKEQRARGVFDDAR
jgi:hypothetical protein